MILQPNYSREHNDPFRAGPGLLKIIQKYFEEKQQDMYDGTLENNPAYGRDYTSWRVQIVAQIPKKYMEYIKKKKYVSSITCHMSQLRGHISCVTCHLTMDRV